MRSWSIPVGRLFGVDVRIHLTFFILPLFIFWTESVAHQGVANGPRDLALVGIILASVAAHECGHILAARRFGLIPKAVILLPLTGVTLFDESHSEKPQPAGMLWKREIRLAIVGPLVNLALAALAVAIVTGAAPAIQLWKWPFLQSATCLAAWSGPTCTWQRSTRCPPIPLTAGASCAPSSPAD